MAVAMQYGSGIYSGKRTDSGITMTLLWTNSSPASSFAAQKVSLDLSGYDAVLVLYRYGISTDRLNSLILPMNAASGLLLQAGNFGSANGYIFVRNISDIDSTGITFDASYRRALNSSSAASSTGDYCYPIYIYGIKGIQ